MSLLYLLLEVQVSCLYDSPDFEVTLSTRFMSEDCLHVSVISSESCIQNGRCPVAVSGFLFKLCISEAPNAAMSME